MRIRRVNVILDADVSMICIYNALPELLMVIPLLHCKILEGSFSFPTVLALAISHVRAAFRRAGQIFSLPSLTYEICIIM